MDKKVRKLMFSSVKDDWQTPDNLYEKYNRKYNFEIDLAASFENKKCINFFSKEQDSLKQNWSQYKSGWLNPPYSRRMVPWFKKCHEESLKGMTIVALLPARTDVRWFHWFVYKKENVEIEFIKGRVKFVGAAHKAPFPSMVVVFNPPKR